MAYEMRLEEAMRLFHISRIEDVASAEELKRIKRVAQRTHPDFQIGSKAAPGEAALNFQRFNRAYGVIEREVIYLLNRDKQMAAIAAAPKLCRPATEFQYTAVEDEWHGPENRARMADLYATDQKETAKRVNAIFEENSAASNANWRIKNWWAVNRAADAEDARMGDAGYDPRVSVPAVPGLTAGTVNAKMEELRRAQPQHLVVRRAQPLALHELDRSGGVALYEEDEEEETGVVNYRRSNPLSGGLQFQDVRAAYSQRPIMQTVGAVETQSYAQLEAARSAFIAPISVQEGERRIREAAAVRAQKFDAYRRENGFRSRQQYDTIQKQIGSFMRLEF